MSSGLRCISVGIALVLAAAPLSAHHSISGKFDPDRLLTLSGRVVRVDWANPHAHIFMDIEDAGAVISWAVELESPIDLEWNGWSESSLATGDPITVSGIVARDGSNQVWANTVSRTDSGRAVYLVSDSSRPRSTTPAGPVPRWLDGQPRLGPPLGETGYWSNPSATSLVEAGVNVETDEHGLLADLGAAAEVAPFQDWALALYVSRQRDFLASDPMFLRCKPPGGPRQFQLRYGVQFAEQRDRDRIFVLIGGGDQNFRMIYTDGRDQVGQVGGDDLNPLYYGRSVAHWEADTFVVDTIGFNEDFWFTNGGLPHTERLHLIERITLSDSNTLTYEVTIDDPGAYTRPWTSSWTLEWIAGEDLPSYFCQDNRP